MKVLYWYYHEKKVMSVSATVAEIAGLNVQEQLDLVREIKLRCQEIDESKVNCLTVKESLEELRKAAIYAHNTNKIAVMIPV